MAKRHNLMHLPSPNLRRPTRGPLNRAKRFAKKRVPVVDETDWHRDVVETVDDRDRFNGYRNNSRAKSDPDPPTEQGEDAFQGVVIGQLGDDDDRTMNSANITATKIIRSRMISTMDSMCLLSPLEPPPARAAPPAMRTRLPSLASSPGGDCARQTVRTRAIGPMAVAAFVTFQRQVVASAELLFPALILPLR
jgi:hypothetical protein